MGTTADRLKYAMELREFKQTDLVEKTGISKGALSSYLSGRYVSFRIRPFIYKEIIVQTIMRI